MTMWKLVLCALLAATIPNGGYAKDVCPLPEVIACSMPLIDSLRGGMAHLTKTTVNNICRSYDKYVKCITINRLDILCKKSIFVVGIEVPMDYVCGEAKQGFLDNMECMFSTVGRMNPTDCQEPMATMLKALLIELSYSDRNVSVSTLTPIYDAVVCSTFSLWACSASKLDVKCGTDAGDWFRGFAKNIHARVLPPLGITVNCTKPDEQKMPVLPVPKPMQTPDCSNSSLLGMLYTCLYAGVINVPERPTTVPTYAAFLQTVCSSMRLEKCWQPVREECPAVVNTVYDQVIVASLSTCSLVKATIDTGCDLTGILEKYTNATCSTINDNYIIKFLLKLMYISDLSTDVILEFMVGFSFNEGGKWLDCVNDDNNLALPEVQRTCGTEMATALKGFDSQIHSMAQ